MSFRIYAMGGFTVVVGAAVVAVACSDSDFAPTPAPTGADDTADAHSQPTTSGSLIDAGDAGPTYLSPEGGRPVAVACSDSTASGSSFPAIDGGECTRDSDCDGGAVGRCKMAVTWGDALPICVYDECRTDSDCAGAHAVCGCEASAYGKNLCFTNSNCRVDGDCGDGHRCALSNAPADLTGPLDDNQGGLAPGETQHFAVGYFCTTPTDQCASPPPLFGSGLPFCLYDPVNKRWTWVPLGA